MGYSVFKTKKMAMDKKNLEEAIKLVIENVNGFKENYEVYEIKNIGRLLEVEVYYHEVDEYYRCVGFEVEIESQFAFETDNGKKLSNLETHVGFYSIWIGKSHNAAPFTFEENYRELGKATRFDNGLGDYAEVLNEIASVKKVQDIYKNIKVK